MTDKWIKNMWYIHTIKYSSAIRKGWNLATCNSMDGPRGYYAKWSQRKTIPHDFTYMWNLKKTKWINKIKTDSQIQRKNWSFQMREEGERLGKTGEEDWGYKSSHRDITYTIVNNGCKVWSIVLLIHIILSYRNFVWWQMVTRLIGVTILLCTQMSNLLVHLKLTLYIACAVLSQLCLTLCDTMDCSLLICSVHGDSPGKNTGVGCRGNLPNPGVLHCRWILYHLSHQGSLFII